MLSIQETSRCMSETTVTVLKHSEESAFSTWIVPIISVVAVCKRDWKAVDESEVPCGLIGHTTDATAGLDPLGHVIWKNNGESKEKIEVVGTVEAGLVGNEETVISFQSFVPPMVVRVLVQG